jgi:hypothetical protein
MEHGGPPAFRAGPLTCRGSMREGPQAGWRRQVACRTRAGWPSRGGRPRGAKRASPARGKRAKSRQRRRLRGPSSGHLPRRGAPALRLREPWCGAKIGKNAHIRKEALQGLLAFFSKERPVGISVLASYLAFRLRRSIIYFVLNLGKQCIQKTASRRCVRNTICVWNIGGMLYLKKIDLGKQVGEISFYRNSVLAPNRVSALRRSVIWVEDIRSRSQAPEERNMFRHAPPSGSKLRPKIRPNLNLPCRKNGRRLLLAAGRSRFAPPELRRRGCLCYQYLAPPELFMGGSIR